MRRILIVLASAIVIAVLTLGFLSISDLLWLDDWSQWAGIGLFAMAVVMLVFLLRLVAARRRADNGGVGMIRIDYLGALMKRLEKLGHSRPAHLTPGEFIAGLRIPGISRGGLDWIVDLYYRQRFGGEEPTAEERRRAMKTISELPGSPSQLGA